MKLLTEAEIRQVCPKAENVIVTGDEMQREIGIKVGLFAQATTITYRMDEETQKRTVRNLYMDLVMMNRRQDEQVRQAAEEARGTGR